MQFTVYSDQATLRWLPKIFEPNGRLVRWRMRLFEFDFNVQYKKKLLHTQADAISRLCSWEETTVPIDADIPTHPLPRDVTTTSREGTGDLDPNFVLTTNTSPSFAPITFDGIRLLRNDDGFF